MAVRRGNRSGGCHPVIARPARPQPARSIEQNAVRARKLLFALTNDAAEHRVHEAGITSRALVPLHQPHRQIDSGMVRNTEPQDLCSPEQEGRFNPWGGARKAAVEILPQQVPQSSQSAQHRRRKRTHERAVALSQC